MPQHRERSKGKTGVGRYAHAVAQHNGSRSVGMWQILSKGIRGLSQRWWSEKQSSLCPSAAWPTLSNVSSQIKGGLVLVQQGLRTDIKHLRRHSSIWWNVKSELFCLADISEHLHVSPLEILVPRDRWGSRRLEVGQFLILFQFKTNGAYWVSVELRCS